MRWSCEYFDNIKGQCAPIDDLLPDDALPHKRKMPKRKKKFGKGAIRGGNCKSGCSDTADQHVQPAVPRDLAAACVVVKRLSKKQL